MKGTNLKKKKSRLLSIFGWILLGFFVLTFFVSISLITINNVTFLRKPVIKSITAIINSSLLAKIEIEDLKFKSHNTIWVKNFNMIAAGDTLANFKQLDLKINFSDLFKNKINIQYIKLKNPSVKLLRSLKDSLWNFDKISLPSEPSDEKSQTPRIIIQYFEIKNGNFIFKDSTYKSENLPFNPLDLKISNLLLRFKADLDINSSKYKTTISQFICYEENTKFTIDSLKFNAYIDTTKILVRNFELNLPASKFKINSQITDYSPLSVEKYNNFDKAKFKLSASAENFNTSSLKKFIYVPFNENIEADFSLNAFGTTNQLNFENLDMSLGNTSLNSSGRLIDFDSDKIIYDFTFRNSSIKENDIKSLLDIDLASIPEFKNAKIRKLSAVGNINKVDVEVDLESEVGDILGKSSVEYYPNFIFSGDILVNQVNLSPILHDEELSSNLSGSIKVSGNGYNLSKMSADFQLNLIESQLFGRSISDFTADIVMDNGIVSINKLNARFNSTNDQTGPPLAENANLEIFGSMDIKELKNPKYKFEISTNGLNLAKLIKVEELPVSVTSKIQINGDGFNPDSIQLSINSQFEEISYSNLSFLPINLKLDVKSFENNQKEIDFKFGEDFIKVHGQIQTTEFLNSLSSWIEYASLFFESRIDQFITKKYDMQKDEKLNLIAKEIKIPQINADVEFRLKSFSLLNRFIPDLSINTVLETKSNISTSEDNILIDFNKISFGNMIVNAYGTRLESDSFSFSGVMDIQKYDSLIRLSYFNMSLDDLDFVKINDLKIYEPVTDVFLADSNLIIDLNAKFDTLASANLSLNGEIHRDNIQLNFENLEIDYLKKIKFSNSGIGRIRLDNQSFLIDNIKLNGLNNEVIALSGFIDTNSIEELILEVSNFSLNNYRYFLPDAAKELMKDFNFHLKNAKVEISGSIESPEYKFDLNLDEILLKNKQIAMLLADLDYSEKNIAGKFQLVNPIKFDSPELDFELKKLPIDLSLTNDFGKINGDYLAKMTLDSLNLKIFEAFQPYVKNIQGVANAELVISGTNEKDYKINGKINTNNSSFKLMENNLDYILSTDIKFDDNKVNVDTLKLVNFGLKSNAKMIGDLTFKENTVSNMNLKFSADNFIILDEQSRITTPQYYGKVNISTKNEGVFLSGNPSDLRVNGDLQINPSNLTIANLSSSSVVTKTNFEYRIKDDKRIYTIITYSDTLDKHIEKIHLEESSSFPDINMNVFIPKSVNLKIDLGAIGEIVAILGTTDPTIPMKYVMDDKNPSGQLFGELIIKQGSTLNSYKTMKASGTITFNTGKLEEPLLNLTAQYDGRIEDQSNPIKYSVFIYITGTPALPKVRFDYTINNMAPQGEQKKIEENALYLLLFGALPGTTDILDPAVMSKLGSAGISSIASKSMSDLLLKTGVIESADVELNSEDFEKSKIQLKGKIFGSMNWSFGGNVADLTKNNQIVIEIPLDVDSKTFNQLVWLISYSTNLNSTTIDPDEKNWEVKFKIGGSW